MSHSPTAEWRAADDTREGVDRQIESMALGILDTERPRSRARDALDDLIATIAQRLDVDDARVVDVITTSGALARHSTFVEYVSPPPHAERDAQPGLVVDYSCAAMGDFDARLDAAIVRIGERLAAATSSGTPLLSAGDGAPYFVEFAVALDADLFDAALNELQLAYTEPCPARGDDDRRPFLWYAQDFYHENNKLLATLAFRYNADPRRDTPGSLFNA